MSEYIDMLAEIYSFQQALDDLKAGKIEVVIAQLEYWLKMRKTAISLIEDQD